MSGATIVIRGVLHERMQALRDRSGLTLASQARMALLKWLDANDGEEGAI